MLLLLSLFQMLLVVLLLRGGPQSLCRVERSWL